MTLDAYFFGCIGEAGHYLWAREPGALYAHRVRFPAEWGPSAKCIDGDYARREDGGISVHLTADDPLPPGWTVVTMNDNSVDHRPGSHATFVLRGRFDEATAIARVRGAFPNICQRLVAMRGGV
jgi:hypothetical protein